MGDIFKPTYTRALPPNAKQSPGKGPGWVSWTDGRGRTRTAERFVPKSGKYAGQPRIRMESPVFFARYRDEHNRKRIVPTGCRHEDTATAFLAKLQRRAELITSNVLTSTEARVSDHANTPIDAHVEAYLNHLRAENASASHRVNSDGQIRRVLGGCGFTRITDLDRSAVERWLIDRAAEGMGARTRNAHMTAMTSFGNWLVQSHRLIANPFHKLPKANERADARRQRRALTADELHRLIQAARTRPLAEVSIARGGRRKPGGPAIDPHAREAAKPKPHTRQRMLDLGWERALIYKSLVLTGLRLNELRSLTVGALSIDGARSTAFLKAENEKAGRGAVIRLRADLADDLRLWLARKVELAAEAVRARIGPGADSRVSDSPLFNVPAAFVKIMNRDLVAAGIATIGADGKVAKRDARNMTLDVHALRTTFNSLLAAGDVSGRVRQVLMRHASSGTITDDHYSDHASLEPRLWAALDVLPELAIFPDAERVEVRKTGSGGARALIPALVHRMAKHDKIRASIGKSVMRNPAEAAVIFGRNQRENKGFTRISAIAKGGARTRDLLIHSQADTAKKPTKNTGKTSDSRNSQRRAYTGSCSGELASTDGGGLAAAIAGLASIEGLTDAERAGAVRALLAERATAVRTSSGKTIGTEAGGRDGKRARGRQNAKSEGPGK